MSDLPPEGGRLQRVVTWRALLAGSVCAAAVAAGPPFGTFKLRASTMALDFSVPAAVFTMFLLAAVVNLVRLCFRRTLLNRGEMLVAYGMMAVSAAICTMGLTGYLVPMLGAPEYFASPENRWREVLLPHMPSWIMLPTAGEGASAIRYMFEGLPTALEGEQRLALFWAWLRPLARWSVFLFSLYGASICLMAIFRKQWVERERIAFPLAQLPMELAGEPQAPRERVAPFFKNYLMWIGFAVPFAASALLALPAYFPYMEPLRPTIEWRAEMLDRMWILNFRISWQTLGLAYLLSSDVALCVWAFGLMGSFYGGLSRFIGFQSAARMSGYGASNFPDLAHFGMGAMIALVLLRLWIGRRHLAGVLRKALCLPTDEDDRYEPMSYFGAFWGTVACFLVMWVWLMFSGLGPLVSLLLLFGAFVGFVGLTRVIAESGVPVSIVPLISSDFVVSTVGTSALGDRGLAALSWTYVWNGDVRTFVMSSAAHGMRVCSDRDRNYRGVFWAMMLAIVVAIVVSVSTTLHFMYQDGGINLHNWFFNAGPQRPFRVIGALMQGTPRPPDLRGYVATAIGAGAMVLLTVARHSFVWWPLNPVGLPISVVTWTHRLWFSIFLAWLVKNRFLKYGGPKLYLKMRPMFLGLVLGQYAGAAFWIAVDGIFGVSNNSVFWI